MSTFLHGRLVSAAQHDVEPVAERERRLGEREIERRDQALPRARIGHGVEDGIVGEQRVTFVGDQGYFEHRWLIDPDSGEISLWTEDGGIDGEHPVDLDDVDLICIDPLPSYVWYQDMADFTDRISDDRAGRRLARAIRGRGAFRRFKDELHEECPDLLQAWYAFRDARAQRRAVEWLVDNDLVDEAQAQQYLSANPEPTLP